VTASPENQGALPRRLRSSWSFAGYQPQAGQLGSLHQADFAKWVAALAGWFSFTGRRALGDFDDADDEAPDAARMAIESIGALHGTLASLDRWAEWLGTPD
jgi:hypothetical protein